MMNSQLGQVTGFPLKLENLEKWDGIFQSDWTSQGKSHKISEKSGNFSQMLSIIFSDI